MSRQVHSGTYLLEVGGVVGVYAVQYIDFWVSVSARLPR